MKKVSWIKRIFWTWEKLEKYFLNEYEDKELKSYVELKDNLQKTNDELREDKQNLIIELNERKKELNVCKTKIDEKEKNISFKSQEVINLQKNVAETKMQLNEKINQNKNIQIEINDKLATLKKIESTFFSHSGNKGKGELGEMQVKTILEKSGFSKDFWTENLLVGKNIVEFAIKSGEKGKWIPIDSKVIESKIDEDNKIIIDKQYLSKVKIQAKEIRKYLGKPNTASYGVLVLQSDSIYMVLYEKFPNFFQEILSMFKIYIASPSSFVQMSWSISQLVEIHDRIKNDEMIYNEMMSALDNVAKFANSLEKTRINFNIAMTTHFPALKNKHDNLRKRLDSSNKLIKQINEYKIKEK